MTRLAPNMFDRRYAQLVELGRSALPSSAPAWTDHNAHDPGITLMELLAWVAEAQLYSLSKTRRDERQAYAALMGVQPHGVRPATGLIWPDHDDPDGPAAIIQRGRIIEPDAPIRLERAETPSFRALHRQLWIPARISSLKSRLADGTVVDHLDANQRGGPSFQPFGADEGRDAVLRMTLSATGYDPLFEPGRPDNAHLIVGVRVDDAGKRSGEDAKLSRDPQLEVILVAGGQRFPLQVVEDTTNRMLRTGFLALDISTVESDATEAVLEFRPTEGSARAPRLIRIEPNVVPVIQRLKHEQREQSDGSPDLAFDLDMPGLEFEPGSDPVTVEVETSGAPTRWAKVDRLEECGPDDRKFELDPSAARVRFGNGVNGSRPPADSQIRATYHISEGPAGNIAANRKWVIAGFTGLFGINLDPTSGGEEGSGWLAQRRDARRVIQKSHALISAKDFEEAAQELPGLEVGRAWMLPPSAADVATGTMRLIAMRTREGGDETHNVLETPRWLESVRRRLAPRVPLGMRLRVIAPQYVGFCIRAALEAEPRKNPEDVRRRALEEAAKRLVLVSDKPGVRPRAFGLPVTRRDLTAWLQALPDVRRVQELSISIAGHGPADSVELPPNGLPRFDSLSSEIQVIRSGEGVE